MLTRTALISFFAALLAAPAGGCAAHEDPVTQPDFETRLVLKNSAGDETREFKAGETITFVVTLTNRASVPRTLTFPTSQTHDCFVNTADHKEVWRHSSGRMFAQMITEVTLKPGESRVFTATWNQTDARSKPVPPGEYEAVGLVNGRAPGCRSEPLRFTIPPATAGKSAGS
jgi:intracellular proteinase inhibitor BsuPI